MTAIFQRVAKNRDHKMDLAKTRYDRKVVAAKFTVGDHVLIRDKTTKKGQNPKLALKYTGPFKIVETANEHHYRLIDESMKRPKVQMVHQNRLKRFHGPVFKVFSQPNPPKQKDKAIQTTADTRKRRKVQPPPAVVQPPPADVQPPPAIVQPAVIIDQNVRRSERLRNKQKD